MTQLEIINDMLRAVGIAPVASMDSAHPSFRTAKAKLDFVNSTVQATGWYFNDYIAVLEQGTDGTIVVPQYATSVIVQDRPNIVIRGQRLYDLNTRSHNVSTVQARVIEVLPLTDIPPSARSYIAARAKFEYFVDEDGTDPKLRAYNNAMQQAFYVLRAEELRQRQIVSTEGDVFAANRYPYVRGSVKARGVIR